MDPMQYALIERSIKRAANWQMVKLRDLPDPYHLREIALLGSYSYSLPQSRRRLVREKDLIMLEIGIPETPTAIARDYLNIKYKRGPIVKHEQADILRDSLRNMPNYANPGYFTDGVYIDIKSAFWHIMNVSGWNVDYWPGKWLMPGTPPDDFPFPAHKVARNCLISAGIPGTISRYIPHGKFDEIKPGSPLANISLYRLISDVLNSIGETAKSLGAVYINTDGFIAPTKNAAAKIIQLVMDWGLIPHIKAEGAGAIKGGGAYKVGKTESVPYQLRSKAEYIENIHSPHYRKWLQKRFAFWARENEVKY